MSEQVTLNHSTEAETTDESDMADLFERVTGETEITTEQEETHSTEPVDAETKELIDTAATATETGLDEALGDGNGSDNGTS